MKSSNTRIKYLFFGLIIVFGMLTAYALKANETPRLILFFGRFHPLLLHLPIGALVVTFFIDLLGRFQKNYASKTVHTLLGFTSFFTILTCFLGYFLSLEGGYEVETLDLHFYTGIGTAVLISSLFWMSLKDGFQRKIVFLPFFTLTLVCISVAGHFGSVLTHGETFLTEYAKTPKKEKTIEVVDSLRLYPNVVSKILNDKCVQCHNTSKQKGELSLLSIEAMLKGGVHGPAVVEGNSLSSPLFLRTELPIEDKEHMPPEGKAQLTKDEKWLLKHWIDTGAESTSYAAGVALNDTLRKMLDTYLVFNEVLMPKASKRDILEVTEAGFRVIEIVPGEAALSVKYIGKLPSKESIGQLNKLKKQIVELNFHAAEISDDMMTVLKKLQRLEVLKINSPTVTDKTLDNMKRLKALKVLNLYNTQITDEGLSNLLQSITPASIYAWNTKVSKEMASTLAATYRVVIQHSIVDGFVEDSQLELPIITPSNTLFKDSIHIGVTSRLKRIDFRYTLDGTEPDSVSPKVSAKIILNNSKTLKVKAFKNEWLPSETLSRQFSKITHEVIDFAMRKAPDERYPNPEKLFDLNEGTLNFSDGGWVGYFGDDLETIIDLGETKEVKHISVQCLENVASWIFYPTNVDVYAAKTKNGTYKKVGETSVSRHGEGGDPASKKITVDLSTTKARFFKVRVKNFKTLPSWHPSAGNPSWLFVDEIYFW